MKNSAFSLFLLLAFSTLTFGQIIGDKEGNTTFLIPQGNTTFDGPSGRFDLNFTRGGTQGIPDPSFFGRFLGTTLVSDYELDSLTESSRPLFFQLTAGGLLTNGLASFVEDGKIVPGYTFGGGFGYTFGSQSKLFKQTIDQFKAYQLAFLNFQNADSGLINQFSFFNAKDTSLAAFPELIKAVKADKAKKLDNLVQLRAELAASHPTLQLNRMHLLIERRFALETAYNTARNQAEKKNNDYTTAYNNAKNSAVVKAFINYRGTGNKFDWLTDTVNLSTTKKQYQVDNLSFGINVSPGSKSMWRKIFDVVGFGIGIRTKDNFDDLKKVKVRQTEFRCDTCQPGKKYVYGEEKLTYKGSFEITRKTVIMVDFIRYFNFPRETIVFNPYVRYLKPEVNVGFSVTAVAKKSKPFTVGGFIQINDVGSDAKYENDDAKHDLGKRVNIGFRVMVNLSRTMLPNLR